MIQVIVFILGVLLGMVLTWVVGRSRKDERAFGGVFGSINQNRKKQIKIQKDAILKLVEERGRITNDEVQKQFGISDSTATRRLGDLETEGFLIENGTKKGVYYELK
jgi:predicted HTH transcriptional regulator